MKVFNKNLPHRTVSFYLFVGVSLQEFFVAQFSFRLVEWLSRPTPFLSLPGKCWDSKWPYPAHNLVHPKKQPSGNSMGFLIKNLRRVTYPGIQKII